LAIAFALLAATAALAPRLLAPGNPLQTDLMHNRLPPSVQHPFGTDRLGRDVYTRVVHGAQYSLLIGSASTMLALAIGVVLGLLAGVGHRTVNETISRLFDVVGSFPGTFLALVLIALTGTGTWNLILAIGIASVPRYGRVVRAEVLVVKESDYVKQAVLNTRSYAELVVRHVLPNALGALPVLAAIGLGVSILIAASLSFLGFGPQPPIPEWGAMLSDARGELRLAWWTLVFPGSAITLVVIASTVIGRVLQRRFERRGGGL
jgi:peptide/nickel transport system permease protein